MSDTNDNTRASCLPFLVLAIAAGGDVNRDLIALRAHFTTVQAANTLANAVRLGFVCPTDQVHAGQKCWGLTAKGQEKLEEARQRGLQLPGEAQAMSPDVLADQALALIAKTPGGFDTEQLAQKLGTDLAQIDAALAPAVAQHRLVTCGVLRGAHTLTQYRCSAGGKGGDWRAHGSLGFHSGMTAQQLQAEQEAQAAKAAELAREVRRSPVRKPGPPRAPAAPAASATPSAPVEVASEVVDAAPTAPPPPAPLPYLGELDIDAAHRKAPVRTEPQADQKAAQKAQEAPDRFLCALYSNGALLIDSNSELVTLPLEHTRKLLRYLDHLGGSEALGGLS